VSKYRLDKRDLEALPPSALKRERVLLLTESRHVRHKLVPIKTQFAYLTARLAKLDARITEVEVEILTRETSK